MSRYIDAEALMQDAVQEHARSKNYFNAIKRMVSNAPTVETKQIKYFDEEEKVWKVGDVIVSNSSEKTNNCTNCECTDDCSECKEAEHGCKDEPQPDCAWK